MKSPFYINKRGEKVVVEITAHARRRFATRWANVYPDQDILEPDDTTLIELFSRAQRIKPQSRKYRSRLRRYGKDTLYFASSPFIFVVQSASLRTVELGTKDTRHLNKRVPALFTACDHRSPPGQKNEVPTDTAQRPAFKLSASALTDTRLIKCVNLGSYQSESAEGRAEDLTP